MVHRDRYRWPTEADIDGLQRQISMAYRDRYQWRTETYFDGPERQVSMVYKDRYQCSTETDINGLQGQISMAQRQIEKAYRDVNDTDERQMFSRRGRTPDSQSMEPEFESPLLQFRSMSIFVPSPTPQFTKLYK